LFLLKAPKLKTLLLDLDETIIHTTIVLNQSSIIKEHPDHIIKTLGEYGEELVVKLVIFKYL